MSGNGKKLDGSRIAAEIREEVGATVAELAAHGVQPRLDVVLVGEDPASKVYVGSKAKTLVALGMESRTHDLPEETRQAELEALIDRLNTDSDVDGILVQLPLPDHVDEKTVTERILPEKDVDGLTPVNAGKVVLGLDGFVPCTPLGVQRMLMHYDVPIAGRHVVVVGRSAAEGKALYRAKKILRQPRRRCGLRRSGSGLPFESTSS